MSNHFDGSASTPEGGLVISSPYGSPMGSSVGGGRGGGTFQVPRLGTSEDEEYFEYYFTLTPVSGDDESDRCTYVPVSIEVSGDEQYFRCGCAIVSRREFPCVTHQQTSNQGRLLQQLMVLLRLSKIGIAFVRTVPCILLNL